MKKIKFTNIYCIILTLFLVIITLSGFSQHQVMPKKILKSTNVQTDSAYTIAVAYFLSEGNIDSAIISAKALDDANKSNEKKLMLGILFEKKGDQVTADKYFSAALVEGNPDSAKIYSVLSKVAYKRKDTVAAKNYMAWAVLQGHAIADRYFTLGKYYNDLNDPDSALISFQKAHTLNDSNITYTQGLFAGYRNEGKVRTALPYLSQWAGVDTMTVQARLILAQELMNLDSFTSASAVLRHLTRVNGLNDTVFYDRGICDLELKDTLSGVGQLRHAIRFAKLPTQMYYNALIAVFEAQGKVLNIIHITKKASEAGLLADSLWLIQYDSSTIRYTLLDSMLAVDGQIQKQTDLIDMAVISGFQKNDLNTLNLLAQYNSLGAALNDTYYILKGGAELKLGRLQDAKADIKMAIQIAPTNVDYPTELVVALLRNKDYQELINLLLTMDPQHMPTPQFTAEDRANLLFKCYTILGNEGKAIPFYHFN